MSRTRVWSGLELGGFALVGLTYLALSIAMPIVYDWSANVVLPSEGVNGGVTGGAGYSLGAASTFSLVAYLSSMLFVVAAIYVGGALTYVWIHWSDGDSKYGDDRGLDPMNIMSSVVVYVMLPTLVAHLCGAGTMPAFLNILSSSFSFVACVTTLKFCAVALHETWADAAFPKAVKILMADPITSIFVLAGLLASAAYTASTYYAVIYGMYLAGSPTVPAGTIAVAAMLGVDMGARLVRAAFDLSVCSQTLSNTSPAEGWSKIFADSHNVEFVWRLWTLALVASSTILICDAYAVASADV